MTPSITNAAHLYGLEPDLVRALILVESDGDPWAWNPEPAYRYLWDVLKNRPFRQLTIVERDAERPPVDFPTLAGDQDQEWWGQQASWGLMQVMGAVARERGFKGRYLTELCHSETNLRFGCAHLQLLFARAQGNVEQALAFWNGGIGGNEQVPYRNQAYATRVLTARRNLRQQGLENVW